MSKHHPAEDMKKDLDNLLSKINALEVAAVNDEYKKSMVKIMRSLVEGQIHTINEFEHMKKALDLLTLQIFELQNEVRA